MTWQCLHHAIDLSRTAVMGIVNVTPDSFSDGGLYYKPAEAIARARNCVKEGAAIIDLGGESTRPGASPLTWEYEWSRIEPVLRAIVLELPKTPISIDTYHPETARHAIACGADIINCVSAESSSAMIELAADTGCALVLPCRSAEEHAKLVGGLDAALAARIAIDPMIGFDTTREEDLALMGAIPRLARLAPLCVGVSRKRLVKKLTGERETGKNLGGSVGAAVWCAIAGASIVRVHDVRETRQAIDVACVLANLKQEGAMA